MQIDFQEAESLLSESMILSDHPDEPMVIRMRYRLTKQFPQFTDSKLKTVTKQFLENNPSLLRYYFLKPLKTELIYPPSSSESVTDAIEKIWEYKGLSEEDFFNQSISPFSLPLFRFNIVGDDFLLLAHHALSDARSGDYLVKAFLNLLLKSDPVPTCLPTLEGVIRRRRTPLAKVNIFQKFKQGLSVAKESTTLRYLAIKHPPFLLGPKTNLFGKNHLFIRDSFKNEELFEIKKVVSVSMPGIELGDILMSAVHLAFDDVKDQQLKDGELYAGDNRISLMTPVDTRRMRRDVPWISNLSALVSVYSLNRHRQNPMNLLDHVHQRMQKIKKQRLEMASVQTLKTLKKFGVFNTARKIMMEHGVPRRAIQGGDSFYKWMESAIVTYVGKAKIEDSLVPYIDDISGYPPVIPPMGFSLNMATAKDQTYFCAHGTDCIVTKDQMQWLLERIFFHIKNYQNCPQTKGKDFERPWPKHT